MGIHSSVGRVACYGGSSMKDGGHGGHGEGSGPDGEPGPTMVTCYESNWAGVERDDLRMERQALERIYLFYPVEEFRKRRRVPWRVPQGLLWWNQPSTAGSSSGASDSRGRRHDAPPAAPPKKEPAAAAAMDVDVAGDDSGRSMTLAILEGVPVAPPPPPPPPFYCKADARAASPAFRKQRKDVGPSAMEAEAMEVGAMDDSGRSLTTCEDFSHVASFAEMLDGWNLPNQESESFLD
mmetsp:Transcript_1161/g.2571  ORF Transcript_1161/g.2571 Transcript_1161/m.2571 type:complete len:237 (-) Transcript_1161:79-789(-)